MQQSRGRGREAPRGKGKHQYKPKTCVDVSKTTFEIHFQYFIPSIDISQYLTPSTAYEVPEFIDLKTKLNAAKSKLDPYYEESQVNPKSNWRYFDTLIDLYKPMRKEIETKYNARHVTNAWMKYWEILNHFNLIQGATLIDSNNKFKAFFNAELPGAAIEALNHYMKTKNIPFDWRASSLLSDSALEDIYGLYEYNREKWLMDEYSDGDSTDWNNILDFACQVGPDSIWGQQSIQSSHSVSNSSNGDVNSKFGQQSIKSTSGVSTSSNGGVDLYSHDAGMDVQDFNRQESINAKLHLGCALAGFLTLKVGGSFIAKQYTYFETMTWNLILIYASMFDKFYISKPLTSRPYNSEIYLIGKGFRGISKKVKEVLSDRLQNFDNLIETPLLSEEVINTPAFNALKTAMIQLIDLQITALNENIELYEKYKTHLKDLNCGLEKQRKRLIQEWLKEYPISPIKTEDQLKSK